MKKITFLLFIIVTSLGFSQDNWTTGTVALDTDFSVKFDVNTTTNIVTMTMIGPSNRWLGVGITNTIYNAGSGMAQFNGEDVLTYNSSTIVDRSYGNGNFAPPADASQNWTISPGGDTVVGGERTVIATRARDTGDSNDFVFPMTPPTSFTLVWARGGVGTNNSNIAFHSGGRNATLASNNVLSNDDFQLNPVGFSITPNPSDTSLNLNITYNSSRNYNMEVYDVLGKQIFRGQLNSENTSIDVSNWRQGVYLVKLSSDEFTETKRFIKQ